MKKRKILLALALGLGLSLTAGQPAKAEAAAEPLYKYGLIDKKGNPYSLDNYGYDKSEILKYYPKSNENIMIPKDYQQEKEQFKSAWVATVYNLHMGRPKNEADFQKMYKERLDTFVDWNMNVMLFQVRPLLDAYYPSKINPTSQYLSGKQGVDVDYDPLEWMIEETHQAGLEYHAWLNPYRVTTSTAKNLNIGLTDKQADAMSVPDYVALLAEKGVLAKDNFAVQNPHLVMRYEGKLILNPGYPETIDHVLATVDEIISNYDVDAIHFDDYFYPYGTNRNTTAFNKEDRDAFEKHGLKNNNYPDTELGLQAWRRDNVTNLIKKLQSLIKNHNQKNKRAVQLGISPFGIWEHSAKDKRGSNTPTGSTQTYSNQIFADTRKWVDDELIDYILPQLYWEFDLAAAPYAELARWWNNVAENKDVDFYVGHAMYKHIDNSGNNIDWFNPELINNQLKFNQQFKNIKGSSLYSYRNIRKTNTANKKNDDYLKYESLNRSIDLLKRDSFSILPLTTAKPWLSHNNVKPVQDLEIKENKLIIHDTVNDDARFYLVYKGKKGQSKAAITSRPENIQEKIFAQPGQKKYTLDLKNSSDQEVYYVSVLDRASVETEAVLVKEHREYVAVNDQVLRWRDSDTAASNAFIPEGSTVEYLGEQGTDWFKVRFEGKEGYVLRGELTSLENYQETGKVDIHETTMKKAEDLNQLVVAIDLNLRSKDESRYRPIKRLTRGTEVQYLGTTAKDWFQVEVDGQKGYIYRGDVTTKKNWEDDSSDKGIHDTEMAEIEDINQLEVLLDVNLRTKDNNQYQPITLLKKASIVKYMGTTEKDWFKVVDENGQEGYVYRGMLTKVE